MNLAGTHLGRFAAVALMAVSGGALYATLIAPAYEGYRQARDRVEVQLDLLAGLRARVHQAASDPRTPAEDLTKRLLYEGGSDALLAAALQSSLRSIGEAAGWRASSTRILPARQDGLLRHVGLEVRTTTTTQGLITTLSAIERARPLLSITSLQVTAIEAGIRTQDDVARDRLLVRMEVFGASATNGERR